MIVGIIESPLTAIQVLSENCLDTSRFGWSSNGMEILTVIYCSISLAGLDCSFVVCSHRFLGALWLNLSCQ